MANVNPKSYSQILGGMINSFLSRLGLPSIKAGDPSLSIMEAASQSDFRNTQELLRILALRNRQNRTGTSLDADGRDEKVARIAQAPSSGIVTLGDSAFAKIQTRIYQGGTGLVSGSVNLIVEDASLFPASGAVYIGRGTVNVEGPLAYTAAPVSAGSYWSITLTSPVLNYHQLGETVVVAQGGDRLISGGTIVSTPTNSAGGQVQFRTLFDAVIPNGETSIVGVPVECQTPGLEGNVAAGLISAFVSAPFATATVTNPMPFTNGTATENDDDYRTRINQAVKARPKAIGAALVSKLVGARALDESSQIISVATSYRAGEPRTLYIDDGTGYEEKSAGVVEEVLVSSAAGGEKFFSLLNRPIAKAFVQSVDGPFTAVPGSTISARVGGIEYSHTFSAGDFRNPTSVSAYEVTASINANATLAFSARTANAGLAVVLFAKAESQEDVEVVASSANDWLLFGDRKTFTLYLYKNDVLLGEDGSVADIRTKTQGDWSALTAPATLNIAVDGIAQVVTIADADFVAAGTPYTSVSEGNSLQSWADVLNYKVAGITATVEGGLLVLVSNRGRNNRASLAVTGGTVLSAMFDGAPVATGVTSDYVLDRNSAQLSLAVPLVAGDKLAAGSSLTRAFVETTPGTVAADSTSVAAESGAELWVGIDGSAQVLQTNIGIGTSLTWASAASAWGERVTVSHATLPVWILARTGDWLVVTDSAVTQGARGAFRIARVVSTSAIEIERSAGSPTGTFALASGGVKLVRSSSVLQRVYLPATAYTPTSMAAVLNSLTGATALVSGTKVRLLTNSYAGNLNVVAANAAGAAIFPLGVLKASQTSHLGVVASANNEIGIPSFGNESLSAVASGTSVTVAENGASYVLANFVKPLSNGATTDRQSNKAEVRSIENESGAGPYTLTVRPTATKEWLVGNRLFYSRGFDLTARDSLGVLMDGDSVSGRYSVDMFRSTKIVALSGTLELAETSGASLAAAFGTGYDWRDYRVDFKARTKSHASPDTSKTILWRWWRHGMDGENAQIQYQYPLTTLKDIAVENNNVNDVIVRLQSGSARATSSFRTTSKIGMAITALSGGLYTYQSVANLAVSAASRTLRINYINRTGGTFSAGACTIGGGGATATIVSDSGTYIVVSASVGTITSGMTITQGGVTATSTSGVFGYTALTLTLPGAVTDHGLAVGDTFYLNSTDANFTSGAKQVVVRTTTTIQYVDSSATLATGTTIGSVSNDLSGEVTVGSPVVTGDIFSASAMVVPDVLKKAVKITLAGSGRDWSGVHYQGTTPSTVLVWYPVTGAAFYPLVANTAAQIATKVSAIANCAVSAVAVGTAGVGTATGTPLDATYELSELGGTSPWYQFSDGYNWVRSHNTPASTLVNYIFTLRNAIAASLATNADVATEDVRLVPVTGSSIARWLASSAVSGIGSRGGAAVTESGAVQIQSSTLGSISSVQVTGGSATVTGTAVRGTGTLVGSTLKVSVDLANGLGGGQYVWAENSLPNDKAVFGATTKLLAGSGILSNGTVTLDSGFPKAWTQIGSLTDNAVVQIERQGQLVCLTGMGPTVGTNQFTTTSVSEGDWVRIQSSTTPPSGSVAVALQNQGVFQVVRVATGKVWIENASAVEELGSVQYDFIAYNSILPGDSVIFGDTTWGDNVGTRKVKALGSTQWQFVLDTTVSPLIPYSSATSLGTSSPLFRVQTAPARLLKEVTAISPNGSTFMDVILGTSARSELIAEAYGTTLIVANKLGYSGLTGKGLDGYRRNTGLIAEANKLVFGDETNVADYEGVASAGASYNISGPIVKRIKIALSIRTSGAANDSLRQRIQSAVASTVNKSKVGESLALSSIATAAQVGGVTAVAILSPAYNSVNDRILVHSYEKALIADLEADISVTFVGE